MWSEAMSTLAKMYPKLSAVELSAILMKGAAMSASLERDSGFNSGSSEHEDDLKSLDQSSRDGLISPENSSEDSVPEVKLPTSSVVVPASGALVKNKRKSSEPLRVVAETELLGPLKKRIRYADDQKPIEEQRQQPHQPHRQSRPEREDLDASSPASCSRTTTSPFRPWAPSAISPFAAPPFPSPADLLVRHPAVTTLHRAVNLKPLEQLQPLALVAKRSSESTIITPRSPQHTPDWKLHVLPPSEDSFVPPRAPPSLDDTTESLGELESSGASGGKSTSTSAAACAQTRNYKNMTRERRIEANARERTRVHTISAAYEKLRRAIPAYSNAQKLSKLSILRIACSYILTLSRMAGEDYSEDASEPSIAECVEMVTKTIQTEGKIRKKKDD
ncbi:transcription factor Atoh8 [Anopheles nili]|uniref:transcription factor Atoh8 n=1 Tax=Anopheles nili TaxID=185578 RepID=UPI00237B9621|nr:transcription factor Atoh8 [Anopheles nili]